MRKNYFNYPALAQYLPMQIRGPHLLLPIWYISPLLLVRYGKMGQLKINTLIILNSKLPLWQKKQKTPCFRTLSVHHQPIITGVVLPIRAF